MLRPPIPGDEQQLIERAKEQWFCNGSFQSTAQALKEITSKDGIDMATAVAYASACKDSKIAELLQSCNEFAPSTALTQIPRVVVMPGAFHVEHPHTGADGARICDIAKDLGWPAVRVPLPSLAPMERNAAQLVKVLAETPGQPTIIVSLSKGGADVRAALARPNAVHEFRNLRAWVNLSGMVRGTPLIPWLRSHPLRCCGVRLLLRLRGQRFSTLDELSPGCGSVVDRPLILPNGLKAIHVVGFPLQRHLTIPWAHRAHARLAPLGPSDAGGILLADALNLPGSLVPVWGADHYLRPPWDIRPLLVRILQDAAQPPAKTMG